MLTQQDIYFYVTTATDYNNVESNITTPLLIEVDHILTSFASAWAACVLGGSAMLIAVNEGAVNALYYNPGNWAYYGTGTPFNDSTALLTSAPGQNIFMNAYGTTSTDSWQLAYNYAYYAVNGSPGPYNPGSAQAPTNVVPPGSTNPSGPNTQSFCNTCSNGGVCYSGSCVSNATLESNAASSGWVPLYIAEATFELMAIAGAPNANTTLDSEMFVAAMQTQGCTNAPNGCYQSGTGYTCNCGSPVLGEGYGVLQDTFTTVNGVDQLEHVQTAYNYASSVGGLAPSAFFPSGAAATPCQMVSDPGVAAISFYFWCLERINNAAYTPCQALWHWIGGPIPSQCCATCEYAAATNSTNCGPSLDSQCSSTCP